MMFSDGYVGILSVCVEGILERMEMDIEEKEPCVYVGVCLVTVDKLKYSSNLY